MEVICKNCGGVFNKPPSHIKRVKNNFCSKSCQNVFQRCIIVKKCVICKSTFNIRPSENKKYSTCNDTVCRKEIKTGVNNPNWRGGNGRVRSKTTIDKVRSTGKYSVWRNNILTIYDGKCVICSTHENIQVHHVVPISIMPELALHDSNGIVLCEYHHKMEHNNSMDNKAVVAVDLDGTLAHDYEGEFHPDKIGKPVPKMMNRVKTWIADGIEVRIFTARAQHPENIEPIRKWLKQNGLPDLLITNQKTMDIDVIWDDKARQVVPNTGNEITESHSTAFSLLRQIRDEIDERSRKWGAPVIDPLYSEE